MKNWTKKIAEGIAAVVCAVGLARVCLAIFMSLVTAMSGCGSKDVDEDFTTDSAYCQTATAEEVAKELGKEWSVEKIGDYYFFTRNERTVSNGFTNEFQICPNGTITTNSLKSPTFTMIRARNGALDLRTGGFTKEAVLDAKSCHEATLDEVVKELGDGWKGEMIFNLPFLTSPFGLTKCGFQSLKICEDGSIKGEAPANYYDSLQIENHPITIRYKHEPATGGNLVGATPSWARIEEVKAFLGPRSGYTINGDGIAYYISFGGQRVSGGHSEIFLKDGIIYGKILQEIEIVRHKDGTFVRNGGLIGLTESAEASYTDILAFLGEGYSLWTDGQTRQIAYEGKVVTEEFDSFHVKDGKVYGVRGGVEREVLANRPKFAPEEAELSAESSRCTPCLVEKGEFDRGDLADMGEIHKRITEDAVKGKTTVLWEPAPDNVVAAALGLKKLLDSSDLPPINDVTAIIGTSCMMEGGSFGSWVDAGLDKPVCLHMPEKGSVAGESPVGKECTANDNEPGKLERDVGPQYKLGHGYKCVPFRRGF